MSVPAYVSAFWGKARPSGEAGPRWHPLAYHMLDVAAVARALLSLRPMTLRRGAQLVGLGDDEALRILPLLAALHDLGKFARPFQSKAPEHWHEGAACPVPVDRRRPHDKDGWLLWSSGGPLAASVVAAAWPAAQPALDQLVKASVSHHGRPVSELSDTGSLSLVFGPGADAALGFAAEALRVLDIAPVTATPPSDRAARHASHWMSGFVALSDWLGSDTAWFPYRLPDLDLGAYWAGLAPNAERAVRAAGLGGARPAALRSFRDATGIAAPTPAQLWAEAAALPEGPCLILIEDGTGTGKTEAAHMLVHRLMAAGRASGVYWAMPTQATANAMYGRQAGLIGRLFDAGTQPNLVLAHGQSALSQAFRSTVGQGGDGLYDGDSADDADVTATAACTAFLAHDRRAALVADLGAGTIDQALLAALPSKFNAMRLFGLAEKVLVLDEIHAYDAYVQAETEALLAFQAALGGSAILLSATLPLKVRTRFAQVWQRALGVTPRASKPPERRDYPMATVVSREGVAEYPLGTAARGRRRVPVRSVHDGAAALAAITTAAKEGAAVAWVRNTVDDAIEAAAQLRDLGFAPMLFHARFAQGDRQTREAEVMRRFGKHAMPADRSGQILVATQVVEQSLDLDFDLMVSDLAPIDLLIQRAGRLRRHPERDPDRPAGVPFAFLVLAPPTGGDVDKDWIRAFLPGTAAVYQDPTTLWRTATALAGTDAIATPDDIRCLIETVYSDDDADVPPALDAARRIAEGEAGAQRALAQHVVLKPGDGYSSDSIQWLDERRVETRLTEGSHTIRLGLLNGDGSVGPWYRMPDSAPPWQAWALSEVRVRANRIPPDLKPPERLAAAVEAARSSWGRFEREMPLLVLEQAEDRLWRADFRTTGGQERQVAYHQERGLYFFSAGI